MENWLLFDKKYDEKIIEKLSKDYNVSKIFASILLNRKLNNTLKLNNYLFSDKAELYDFSMFKDGRKGAEILINAIKNNKKICIFGDYDVDGIISTTICYKGLKALGADVFYYIPDRIAEGYGMNIDAVKTVCKKGCDLILTCDNGISCADEIGYAKENGIDCVIVDHHEPKKLDKKEILPMADAVIDAKQKDCNYPFKGLCAGTMSYKFIKYIYELMNEKFTQDDEFLALAAIATICDIMDLTDENRTIVTKGLKILNRNKKINKGIYELLKIRNILDKDIGVYDVGFIIGPCLNAAGRLDSALLSVKLLVEDEVEIAQRLYELNDERKSMTQSFFERLSEALDKNDDKVKVLYCKNMHESIAGIVAGRIKEKFNYPSIVFCDAQDEGCLKGSGRSIERYNMFEELLKCDDLFVKYGGHKLAAGMTIKKENFEELKKRLNENCTLTEKDFLPMIKIDKAISFEQIDMNLANELNLMKPFGKGNEKPVFATKNVVIKNLRFVGKEQNILSFESEQNGIVFKSVAFDLYDKMINFMQSNNLTLENFLENNKKYLETVVDLVYYIDINEYCGNTSVQLNIKDIMKAPVNLL